MFQGVGDGKENFDDTERRKMARIDFKLIFTALMNC